MWVERVPLQAEPIDGAATVAKYDRYAAQFIRPEYRYTVHKIMGWGIKKGRVLDIGCGSGRLALELAGEKRADFAVVGIDVSADMLKQARINTGGQLFLDKVQYVQATAARMPFPNESFEIVTSYASLHHWKHPEAVFEEMWRITKENGLILLRDNRRVLGNPFYRAGIWAVARFMRKEERGRWPKSILASYTLAEVGRMLGKTKMKKAHVRADMGGFDLCIVVQKNSDTST
jgi:ubiquinone/menaquinone biosynthesis C-methylase UbiE